MNHLRRIARWLRSKVANRVSEWLSEYVTRRTSGELIGASAAIAASQMLNVEALLEIPEEDWPEPLAESVGYFTAREWRTILPTVKIDRLPIERALRDPQWAHLGRTQDA